MIKKILLFLILLMTFVVSTNAVTELNSCGKNSGWLDNEIYILNFTSVSPAYVNDYCFQFPQNTNINNVTFQGLNQTIFVEKDLMFFQMSPQDNNWLSEFDNMYFKDFEVEMDSLITPSYSFARAFEGSSSGWNWDDWNFENVKVKNFKHGLHLITQGAINNISVSNSQFDVTNNVLISGGNPNTIDMHLNNNLFIGLNFKNSIMEVKSGINNVYIMQNTGETGYYFTTNTYNQSLIKGYNHTDSNNDNLADSDIYTGIVNSKISIELFGYNFIQDIFEGNSFIGTDEIIVTLNNEDVTFLDNLELNSNNVLDSSYALLNLTNKNSIVLSNAQIDCDVMSSEMCYMSSEGNTDVLSGLFRGMIGLNSNVLINNINFESDTGSHTDNIIANENDFTYNNVTISNSIFNVSSNQQALTPSEEGSRQILKLKGYNVNIFGNTFNQFNGSIPSLPHDMLYIDVEDSTTNKIHSNTFTNVEGGYTNIFSWQCDTLFYNNYVGTNVNLSQFCDTNGLNLTPLVGFNHTDGKVYYYYLGNYYEDNVGCVDLDNDDFCDSSYSFDGVIDSEPLAVTSFNYTSQLLTADMVVDSTDFNITLVNIVNDENVTLSSASDTIILEFNHDSDFIDLTCDWILDGSVVNTEFNVPSLTTQSYNQTGGWINKSYTYRVECYNDFSGVSSNEVTFNVNITGEPTNGEPTNGNGLGVDVGDVLDFDDIEGSAENTQSLLSSFVNLILIVGIPIVILLVLGGFFIVLGNIIG